MTINEMAVSDTRPLLPGDEEQINSQLSKKHAALQDAERKRKSFGSVGVPIRKTSSRSTLEPFENDSLPIRRALTNTDKFIPIQNTGLESSTIKASNSDYESSNDEQVSLGSEDNLTHRSEMEHGMRLDPSLKKQREEWADKGAAKLVRDVTDPKTGQTSKEVIKKGIKDFKFGDVLGDGSYSTVMTATAKDSGKKYAVKVLSKEYLIRQKKVKYVNIEKNALQRLNNSRGIIKLFFTFQDESSLYFLLEYAPNGDFLSIMKKYGSLSEECTCYYSAQIIDAIKFLHTRGIIHRDIKPENILLDREMKVKLTDFGTAKLLESKQQGANEVFDLNTRSRSFVGTAEYVSPELLNDNWVDSRCDIWAFGCIIFQMIAGKPPFKATNEYLTFQKVMKVQYAFTAGFPVVIRDLVKRILMKNPDQRLTIPHIERHYFFRHKNFKDGSIWSESPPEIQPYKVSARSMQPIPALNNHHQHRNHHKKPLYIKFPSTGKIGGYPDSAGTSLASTIGSSDSSGSTSSNYSNNPNINGTISSSTGSSKLSSPIIPAKKVADDPTVHKLDRREADNRRHAGQKRSNLTLSSKKSQHSPTTPSASSGISPGSVSTGASHARSKSAAMSKSANSDTTPMSVSSNDGSSSTAETTLRKSASPPVSHGHPGEPSGSKPVNNEVFRASTTGNMDSSWEFCLKDVNEHVLGAGEINFAVTDNSFFEKRVHKSHGSLCDPQRLGSSRATLLSQVARGGGGVTGLRNEHNSATLSESDYYCTFDVNFEDLHPDYRVLGGDASLNPKIEKEASPDLPSEGYPGVAISNKFRKFFYPKQEPTIEPIDFGNYYRRMLVITSFGRVLILSKRIRASPGSSVDFDLCYDINLSQSGVKIKEVFAPLITGNSANFVIQTPYDSFLFRTNEDSIATWLNVLNDCIKKNHERLVSKSKKEAKRSDDAMQAAKLASPVLAREKSLQQEIVSGETYSKETYPKETHPKETRSKESHHPRSHGLGSPSLASSRTPKTHRPSPNGIASENSSIASFSGANSSSRSAKTERMFDSYVNLKEKSSRRHISPVPTSSKLVGGLPYHNYNQSVGLGISSKNAVNSAVNSAAINASKTARKAISPSNSRLLARSEQTLRRKH